MALEPPAGYEMRNLHEALRMYYRDMGMDRSLGMSGEKDAIGIVQQDLTSQVIRAYGMPVAQMGSYYGTVATMRLNQKQDYAYYDPPVSYREAREIAARKAAVAASQETAPAVNTRKVPPGVHFTPEKRIGDEARSKYLDHLGYMMSHGFIDNAEYDARLAEMMTAKTREDLEFLVKDLPGMTVGEPPEEKSTGFVHLAGAMSIGGWGYVLVMLGVGLLSWTLGIWLVIFFAISLLFCILHTRK